MFGVSSGGESGEKARYVANIDIDYPRLNILQIIISPETPYVVALLLSHFRTSVLPSFIAEAMTIKNHVEIEGARRAYLRDGAAFVRFPRPVSQNAILTVCVAGYFPFLAGREDHEARIRYYGIRGQRDGYGVPLQAVRKLHGNRL